MNKLLLLLSLFFCFFQIEAKESRFHRIIASYSNDTYTYDYADVLFQYKRLWDDEKDTLIDHSQVDTGVYRFEKNYVATEYHNQKILGRKHKDITTAILGYLRYFSLNRENTLNRVVNFYDTTTHSIKAGAHFRKGIERYDIVPWKSDPFLQCLSHSEALVSHQKRKGFEPGLEALGIDSLREDFSTIRDQQVKLNSDLILGCGLGKHTYVAPLYQALKLEGILKRDNVIQRDLSDETIHAIARLLAQTNSYKSKGHQAVQTFKKELDSVIIQDSAITEQSLRYVSPLRINRALLYKSPYLFKGPKFTIYSKNRLSTGLHWSDTSFPHDAIGVGDSDYVDTQGFCKSFTYRQALGMRLDLGIPVKKFMYLNISGYRHLFASDKRIKDYYDNHEIFWDEVLDIRWDMYALFWRVNALMIKIGVKNMPTWCFVPRKQPHTSYITANLFIENYLTLSSTFSYTAKDRDHLYGSYAKWQNPYGAVDRGYLLSVTMSYNFKK